LTDREQEVIGPKIEQLTLRVVAAIQNTNDIKVRVKDITCQFLVEDSEVNDAWFVGVDFLQVWKSKNKAKAVIKKKL